MSNQLSHWKGPVKHYCSKLKPKETTGQLCWEVFLLWLRLWQVCPLLPLLLIVSMGRISQRSRLENGVGLVTWGSLSLLSEGDACLLASSCSGLQLTAVCGKGTDRPNHFRGYGFVKSMLDSDPDLEGAATQPGSGQTQRSGVWPSATNKIFSKFLLLNASRSCETDVQRSACDQFFSFS